MELFMGRKQKLPAYRLGIDLGGTKMHAVVINAKGSVLATARRATKPEDGYRSVLKRLRLTIEEVAEAAKIKVKDLPSVGLGMPGPIDEQRGIVHVAPNLGWKNKPVAKDLGKLIKQQVVLGNDVNYGALGEAVYGAAAGASSAFAAFVGTGLGGGLIINGHLLNGRHGFAGEFGHIPAPFDKAKCSCGLIGCLETSASKTGIVRLIKEAKAAGATCSLTLDDNAKPKSSQIRQAWQDGCPATTQGVKASCRALAWGLSTVAAVVDPAVFILGGGVMEALGKDLVKLVRENMSEFSLLYGTKKPDFRLAKLGDDAGAIGAAIAGGQPEEVSYG
jgi:glucokinase